MKELKRNMKAMIFDLDDTLYNEKDYVRSGFHAVAELFPQIDEAEKKLWEIFLDGKSAIDTFLINENIYTEDLKSKCLSIYRNHKPGIQLDEKVISILSLLRTKGIMIGIITDGRPEGQRAKIHSLNLEKYVDEIIITDDLGGIQYRKPNELAYSVMKERLHVSYYEMVYIGDNPAKDFIAPLKLGMGAWFLNNPDGLYSKNSIILENDIRRIDNIEELSKLCADL
jgi:putative hydrolase of the HAD superfamily